MDSLNVVGWLELLQEWGEVRSRCWSDNTWKSRKSQWKRYNDFCTEFDLVPIPADVETVGIYIVYLSRTCCYVTIANYISGVWALHDHWGVPHIDPTSFILRSTLQGAKRLLGCESVQSDPLSPEQMKMIWAVLDLSVCADVQFWTALCLMYRCLLRVSHVVASPHTIRNKDIVHTREGVDVCIRSSKTIQFRERKVIVPVIRASGSVLCPCAYLQYYMAGQDLQPEAPLFPYTYNMFSNRLKKVCIRAGLQGRFTTPSLRRGSATFLSSFLPMHVIKTYGDWKSWAVLLYISDNYAARKDKDYIVADKLSAY